MKDPDKDQVEDREPTEEPSNTPVSNESPITTSYFEKIVKHIPAGLNAAYIASLGLLAETAPNPAWLHWVVFLSLWTLVPLYVIYLPGQIPDKSVSKRYCVLAATISFAVWVYAIDGGPVALSFPDFYQPIFGSLLLIITTLVLPVLEKILMQMEYFRLKDEQE